MKKIPLATFMLLASYAGFAQIDTLKQEKQTPPSPVKWTLKQCVEYALVNNLDVKRGTYLVENSEVDLRQARMSRLPSVGGNASYGYSWGRGLDPVNNDFVTQEIRSSNLSANASLPLYNGMRIQNSVKQYSRAYSASEADLAKAKNDVILNVANLFINVVFNKELVENAKFQLASSQQQLDRTRKQVLAGALPKSEELDLDAQVASNEVTLVQQENALALSILQLKQALLIPAQDPLDVEIPNLDPEDLVLAETRDEIFELASKTMPEIKSASYKIESAEYAIRAARGNLQPRLSLVGSINTNYSSTQESVFYPDGGVRFSQSPVGFVGNQDTNTPVYTMTPTGTYRTTNGIGTQFKDNVYRTLGVQLSIPIFNGYTARAGLQRAAIQRNQAQVDAIQVSNTLRQTVERAYNDAVASSKTYNSSLRQVSAREESFRMMNQRYTAGSANSFEFQVAQNNLFQAQTDLARAKYDFIFKKKVLDFYQGKTIEY